MRHPSTSYWAGVAGRGVTAYGHANATTVDAALTEIAHYVALGYRAVRVQVGVPGLAATYGVGTDRMFYEPAEPGVPPEACGRPSTISAIPRLSSPGSGRSSGRT